MTPRRRLLAALTAGVAGFLLTGCERPAPIVTVVSGTHSEWKEADVWCFEDQTLEDGDCAERAEGPASIPVRAGERVGIDVSEAVVDRGWFYELALLDDPSQSQVFEVPQGEDGTHYFSFPAPASGLRLTVRAFGEAGPGGPPSGEWTFHLVEE